MTSNVSICNQALSLLGENPITSFEENSSKAELCSINFDNWRDAVLEACSWTFATDRAISLSSIRDDWDQMYVHPIPPGWISVFRSYSNVSNHEKMVVSRGWRKEGDQVLTYETTAYLWGNQRIVDPTEFSPMFIQALVQRIAAELAIPITHDATLHELHYKIYLDKLFGAMGQDGKQGSNEREQSRILSEIAR